MNNSASLKSYSISERNSMDNRKSGIIFLFECSASYFLLLECAISWYHEARARVGSAWLFPSAEIHSLPHVMLSVACWSWPIYLISFYGGIFWNTKKSILVYLPQEMQRKCCQSGRMAGQELLSLQLCFTGSVTFLLLPSLWFWLESVAE